MSKCLILDDDEMCVPFAKSPIDDYRGSGKSLEVWNWCNYEEEACKWNCVGSTYNKGMCRCVPREKWISQRIDVLRKLLSSEHGYIVSFGKHKGSTFKNVLYDNKEYCDWFRKNATDKKHPLIEYIDKSYELKEQLDDYYRIHNPRHD